MVRDDDGGGGAPARATASAEALLDAARRRARSTCGALHGAVVDDAHRDGRAGRRRRPDQRVGDRRRRRRGQVGDPPAGRSAPGAAADRRAARRRLRRHAHAVGAGHLATADGAETAGGQRRRVSARRRRRLDVGGRPDHRRPPATATRTRSRRRPPTSARGRRAARRAVGHRDRRLAARRRAVARRRVGHARNRVRPRRFAGVPSHAPRGEIAAMLDELGALAGTPVIEGHGDLHVGQVLRSGGRFVVTDFDGNPVLTARGADAADPRGPRRRRDDAVAGARRDRRRKYTALDADALWPRSTRRRARRSSTPTRAGSPRSATRTCTTPARCAPSALQQVLREIVYAARHLPRWMYVPDAALPALLDEGTAIVKPDGFAADLHRKPEVLRPLAATLAAGNPWAEVVPPDVERVVLLGMGSSAYAGGVAAARMRAAGLIAYLGVGVLATASRRGARARSSWRRRPAAARSRPSTRSSRLPDGGAHDRADQHAGVGDHRALRRRRRPGGRTRGRRRRLPQLPAHAGAAAGARVPSHRRRHRRAGRVGGRGSRGLRPPPRHRVRLAPSDFRASARARRAPTSPRPRTGSVRPSRAR